MVVNAENKYELKDEGLPLYMLSSNCEVSVEFRYNNEKEVMRAVDGVSNVAQSAGGAAVGGVCKGAEVVKGAASRWSSEFVSWAAEEKERRTKRDPSPPRCKPFS